MTQDEVHNDDGGRSAQKQQCLSSNFNPRKCACWTLLVLISVLALIVDFESPVQSFGNVLTKNQDIRQKSQVNSNVTNDKNFTSGSSHSVSAVVPLSQPQKKTTVQELSNYCKGEGSLQAMALQMANFSSPPGSLSYQKTLHILLQQASSPTTIMNATSASDNDNNYFHIALPPRGIFSNVAENMAAMLQGFGLEPINITTTDSASTLDVDDNNILWMEISFYGHRDRQKGQYVAHQRRIILQSEQLEQVGNDYSYREYLRECHVSPLCVIWDFSDHHYRTWYRPGNISDSVMLLPIMHQSLLLHTHDDTDDTDDDEDDYIPLPPLLAPPLQPLAQRPLDMVFFGSMKERRTDLLQSIHDDQQQRNWTFLFEYTTNLTYVHENYLQSKICLIVHSYAEESAGEYHRLNELATAPVVANNNNNNILGGCIPVVETFADSIGIQAYQQCGGIVFASYDNLIPTIQRVLDDIHQHNATTLSSIDEQQAMHLSWWWDYRIQWDRLLVDIFRKQ